MRLPAVCQVGLISLNFPLLLPAGFISMFHWKDLSLPSPTGQINLEEYDPTVIQFLFGFPSICHHESQLRKYKI